MAEKSRRIDTPAIQPNCDIAHARDRTPAPIAAVIMCAHAVHTVPIRTSHFRRRIKFYILQFQKKKIIANQMLKVVWIVVWGGGLDGEFLFRAKKSKWITYE